MGNVQFYSFSTPVGDFQKSPSILKENERNSLFKFEKGFFEQLQSVSSEDVARSIPYISLHSLDQNGQVIEDLNVNFFFKGIDFDGMKKGFRHGDRPIMSLKKIELKTSQPSGSGYLYFTEVILTLKIHAPSFLSTSQVMSLMLPGMSHLLEYGWNSPNEFLNDFKEKLYFNVTNYDVSYDEMGQVDLTVRGMAFNDLFNNTFVGDVGQTGASNYASDRSTSNLAASKEKRDEFVKYLQDCKKNGEGDVTNSKIKQITAKDYSISVEEVSRGEFSKEFRRRRGVLEQQAVENRKTKRKEFKLHDVIQILLGDTFDKVCDAMPAVDEFRIIYGDINEKARDSGIPINLASFPISVEKFNTAIKDSVRAGSFCLTVKQLLNILTDSFIENDQVWKDALEQVPESERKKGLGSEFNRPDIVVSFSNRYLSDRKVQVVECTIHDINFDIPVTTANLPEGKSSESEMENSIIGNSGLQILRTGHAQSFIKKLNLTSVADEAMKTALIVRMNEDRVDSLRSSKIPSSAITARPVSPLRLPFQGTINVLGHTKWKPFKAFYLDTGFFLMSGVYKIMAVSHSLSSDGFTTQLDIFPN